MFSDEPYQEGMWIHAVLYLRMRVRPSLLDSSRTMSWSAVYIDKMSHIQVARSS